LNLVVASVILWERFSQIDLIVVMSFSKSWVLLVVFLFVGCGGGGGETAQMQQFNATVSGIDAEGPSISVTVPDSAEGVAAGSMNLAFTDSTQILKNYMAMSIDSLQVDQVVHIEAMRDGDQYVPSRVLILGN
jgi:2-polyprenyl-3-methyl-5-hydroxy-6-metoxy-1,4-benzoquinol methylase